jgi:hypothetical protein
MTATSYGLEYIGTQACLENWVVHWKKNEYSTGENCIKQYNIMKL